MSNATPASNPIIIANVFSDSLWNEPVITLNSIENFINELNYKPANLAKIEHHLYKYPI